MKSKKVLAFFAILYYNTEINKRRLFEARKEQNCHERKNWTNKAKDLRRDKKGYRP